MPFQTASTQRSLRSRNGPGHVPPWVCLRPGVSRRGVLVQVDLLVFDRPPQPFDEDIVERATATVHADGDLRAFEAAGEVGACELRALVGVENFRDGLVGPWIVFDDDDAVRLHAALGFGILTHSLSFGLEVGWLDPTSMIGVRVAFPL